MLWEKLSKTLLRPRLLTSAFLSLYTETDISSQKAFRLVRHRLWSVNPCGLLNTLFSSICLEEEISRKTCSINFPGKGLKHSWPTWSSLDALSCCFLKRSLTFVFLNVGTSKLLIADCPNSSFTCLFHVTNWMNKCKNSTLQSTTPKGVLY